MIQIWSLSTPHPERSLAVETTVGGEDDDEGGMTFEMGLLLGDNEGEARDLQWCPRGGMSSSSSEEQMDVDEEESTRDDKLGILAGVFTDGKVKVFAVAKPDSVREKQGTSKDETVYGESCFPGSSSDTVSLRHQTNNWIYSASSTVKAKKVLELTLPNTSCLSFSWGSWETIAVGCLNGTTVSISLISIHCTDSWNRLVQVTSPYGPSGTLFAKG
jgi:hypothetical protein